MNKTESYIEELHVVGSDNRAAVQRLIRDGCEQLTILKLNTDEKTGFTQVRA